MTNKEIDTQARRVDDVPASAEHWRKVAELTQAELDALKAQLAFAKEVLKDIWVQGVCAGDLKYKLAETLAKLESKGAGET